MRFIEKAGTRWLRHSASGRRRSRCAWHSGCRSCRPRPATGWLTAGAAPALTASTSPNHWRRASIRCEPEAPSHPPPAAGSYHQSGMGKMRSMDRNEAPSISLGVPISPESRAHPIQRLGRRPAELVAQPSPRRRRRRPPHQLLGLGGIEGEGLLAQHVAAGFDGLGRQAARGWRGLAMDTASRPSSSASASEVHACAIPSRSPRRAVRPGPRRPGPRPRSRPARRAGTWMRAPKDVPTTATAGSRPVGGQPGIARRPVDRAGQPSDQAVLGAERPGSPSGIRSPVGPR